MSGLDRAPVSCLPCRGSNQSNIAGFRKNNTAQRRGDFQRRMAHMTIRSRILAAAAAVLLASAAMPAMAVTLRYANQGDLKSLDPYTVNETTTNAHLGHVYEGLTRRGKDLSVQPSLAERWQVSEDGLTWRFF